MTIRLSNTTVSEIQAKCLVDIADQTEGRNGEYLVRFYSISKHLGIRQDEVRRAVRALKRKGLVEHSQAFGDDGYLCGSGHGVTVAGQFEAAALRISHKSLFYSPDLVQEVVE
jgi:hypothetical protein